MSRELRELISCKKHLVFDFDGVILDSVSIKTEAYYQYLYEVPVTIQNSSFSMINMGSGFSRIFPDSLQNTGTGYNYGLELTVQKYFTKSFFFLFSGTIYDSKYRGSDGVLRSTSYNGAYVVNFLAGKEFSVGSKNTLGIGIKATRAGGQRYCYSEGPPIILVFY